jgi:hypothetical protein
LHLFTKSLKKTYLQHYPSDKDLIKPIETWDIDKYFPIGKEMALGTQLYRFILLVRRL